jgi:hypothetical protein
LKADAAKEDGEQQRLELAHNHRNPWIGSGHDRRTPGMARDLEMTQVTMITSKTNMRGSLVTVCALC